MSLLDLVAVGAVSLLSAWAIIPQVRRLAIKYELLDLPDGMRRIHSEPIPRLGGVGVLLSFSVALATLYFAAWKITGTPPEMPKHAWALLIGCVILFVIGLADDLRGVPPLLKILGQTCAALVICDSGYSIQAIGLPGHYTFALGWLALPITVLWLVGMSNAFNLVDGMDGLAGGIGVIAILAAAVAATVNGHRMPPIYAAALIGALLGFLRFNFPPARIFLGDSGSLVIGLLLAFITVRSATLPDGTVLVLVPLFALAYPLLDTAIAMLRRWLRGDPLSRADGRHIHHQLRGLGLSSRRALGIICLMSFSVAALGLSVTFLNPVITVALGATGGAILLLLFVYGIRWLEYHEFLEAGSMVATAASRARGAIRDTIYARDMAKLITDARSRSQVDEILQQHASKLRFSHIQISSAHSPTLGGPDGHLPSPWLWKFEYPVMSGVGDAPSDSFGDTLMLTIWCPTKFVGRPASAERVAQILGPAIAVWNERMIASGDTEVRKPRNSRPSGPHRQIADRPAGARRSSREMDIVAG